MHRQQPMDTATIEAPMSPADLKRTLVPKQVQAWRRSERHPVVWACDCILVRDNPRGLGDRVERATAEPEA
jgi:hypothetical protein